LIDKYIGAGFAMLEVSVNEMLNDLRKAVKEVKFRLPIMSDP
jgi:hypothetical protein